jgi:hypothetical protein
VAPANAAHYTTAVECRNGGGTVVATGSNAGPLDVPVPSGAAITCTIRNAVIRPTLTVVKRLVPASDPGRFDLQIDGITRRAGAGDGDGTGPVSVDSGTRTVGETAVAPATAAQYATAIECRNASGAVVASASTAGPLAVPAANTDKIECVVTNTRNPVPPLTLTGLTIAPKIFAPGQATARFALSRSALVVVRIDRVLVGKTRRGRCTVTDAARKSGARCVRYDPISRSTVTELAGVVTTPIDGVPLGPGRYRLRVAAVDGGTQTVDQTVRFRIT